MSRDSKAAVSDPSRLSYSEAMAELEDIVTSLDEGSADIDTIGAQFQRAIEIVEDLDGRILKTQSQLNALTPRIEQLRNAGLAATERVTDEDTGTLDA